MNRPRVVGLTALASVAVVLVGVLLHFGHLAGLAGASPRPAPVPSVQPQKPGTQDAVQRRSQRNRTAAALRVLQSWDAQRATAYAAGSPRRLGRLYTSGSRAGSADVRLLAAYQARGFHVVGMRTQLLRLDVLRADRAHWVLRVEDRLARATAVGRGRHRLRLPRDETSTRTITMLRAPSGRWQVARVADG